MVGADLEHGGEGGEAPIELARAFDQVIRERIGSAIVRVASEARPDRVVTCGSGAFAAEAAVRSSLEGVAIVSLANRIGDQASAAACAYALGHLP